jgi:hypothetical protein
VLTGGAHVVARAGQRWRDPHQPADRAADDLHVQPVGFVLAPVEGAVSARGRTDSVDAQQYPVEDTNALRDATSIAWASVGAIAASSSSASRTWR